MIPRSVTSTKKARKQTSKSTSAYFSIDCKFDSVDIGSNATHNTKIIELVKSIDTAGRRFVNSQELYVSVDRPQNFIFPFCLALIVMPKNSTITCTDYSVDLVDNLVNPNQFVLAASLVDSQSHVAHLMTNKTAILDPGDTIELAVIPTTQMLSNGIPDYSATFNIDYRYNISF